DHARAGRDLRLRLLRRAEEAAEERVAQERVLLLGALLQHRDVHNRRRHLLEDGSKSRQAVPRRDLCLRRKHKQEKEKLHSSDSLSSEAGRRSRTSVFIGTSLRRRLTSSLPYSKYSPRTAAAAPASSSSDHSPSE